jgi:prepilin-type N-terminal cleavage/methylation domain-containing protein
MKMRSMGTRAMGARGFTLLELLVSSAIIGIMMMVLLTATTSSLGLWRGAEQRIAVDREGRNGLALMADDLANMLVVPGSVLMPQFDHWDDGVFMEFAVLRPADYQESGQGNVGDVCYVRYKYDSENNTVERSHVDSAATFASLGGGVLPPAGDYELLADNVTFIDVNTYNESGGPANSPAGVRMVHVNVGVRDKQEVENIRRGIPVPDARTTMQYFSISGVVPRTP